MVPVSSVEASVNCTVWPVSGAGAEEVKDACGVAPAAGAKSSNPAPQAASASPRRKAAVLCIVCLSILGRPTTGASDPRRAPTARSTPSSGWLRGLVQELVARGRVALFEAGGPGLLALLRGAVVAGVAGVEVADGERGVEGLVDVAVVELAAVVRVLGPGAGVAVGLELECHRGQLRAVLVVEAELALHLVAVLVGDDVGHGEVAGRLAIALRAARQLGVERALVDVGRQLLGDVDRVV